MDDFVIWAVALKFIYAVLGALGALYFSAWLDRRAGINFKTIMWRVGDDPRAAAMYFGLRFFGVCLLLGLLVS